MPPLTVKSPKASEFDPGGKKAAARARALAEAVGEAAQGEAAQVEATPVEAPVEAVPARRAVSPVAPPVVAELGPLVLHPRTVEHLRDLAHGALLTADSCLDVPDGAEVLQLAATIQRVLARAVAGRPVEAAPSSPAAPAEADDAAAPVEAPAPDPVEAPVEAPAPDPVEAPAAPAAPARRR